jgi:hypothetical protein
MRTSINKSILALASLLIAGSAQASGLQTHGAQFSNYDDGEGACEERYTYGIANACNTTKNFILGMTKPYGSNAYDVWLDGSHNSTSLTTYLIFSAYAFDGTYRQSVTRTISGVSGHWSTNATFTNAEGSSGYISIYAQLPGSWSAFLYGAGVYDW